MDVGGTFTDIVLVDDEHDIVRLCKVATTPREPERAVCDALRQLVDGGASVEWLGHATTIATNALLGQVGLEPARVALVTTEGFRDVVEIGRQNRSRVYDLFVERPKALVAREDRYTVRERIDHRGAVVEPLDVRTLEAACEAIARSGVRSVAVCLLNSYANGEHERLVAQWLGERCGAAVTCSSRVNPEYREYERFSTAVVSAALAPIVGAYLDALARDVRALGIAAPLFVMRSDGGMSDASAAAAQPASLIESGPAGGVIAAAAVAAARGIRHVLSFDMGGTTAKAGTVVDGVAEIATEYEAAGATHSGRAIKGSGYPVRYPFIDLSEVSAGGGTIAWIDDAGSLRVGPVSAGADPGPACYGRSDRATVTDANVVLGRLNQTHLLGGTFAIDASRSYDAIATLARALGLGVEETAAGIRRIVDAQMAKVLRIVTVERGLDPRDFTMLAFGGNGPLHACELADELGIARVVVPPAPGVFSAEGLLVAELSATLSAPVLRTAADVTASELDAILASLEARGRDALRAQGAGEAYRVRRTYDARYAGQSFELPIEHDESPEAIAQRFHAVHRARYGYSVESEPVELVNARVTVAAERSGARVRSGVATDGAALGQEGTRRVWIGGTFADARVVQRDALVAGSTLAGPAIVEQYDATSFVPPGWSALVASDGVIEMERSA